MKTTAPSETISNTWFVVLGILLAGAAVVFLSRTLAQSLSPAQASQSAMTKEQESAATKASADLRKKLTPEQYYVTQQNGTEPAFHNEYWNNHNAGIYVDVVSGEPLFSSLDKFDSGTGWPSFSKPLPGDHLASKKDTSFGMDRDEIRSKESNAHLGHLFDDGPAPTGLRYCINSAALRFIPVEKMQAEGYGQYLSLFENKK